MAISWETTISNVDVVSKRADVNFKRTDSEAPSDEFTITFRQVILETQDERTALLNLTWLKWQEELTNRSNISAFVTNLEQLANASLDAREV